MSQFLSSPTAKPAGCLLLLFWHFVPQLDSFCSAFCLHHPLWSLVFNLLIVVWMASQIKTSIKQLSERCSTPQTIFFSPVKSSQPTVFGSNIQEGWDFKANEVHLKKTKKKLLVCTCIASLPDPGKMEILIFSHIPILSNFFFNDFN